MICDSDSQCTPADIAVELGEFDLDPCSNSRSHIKAKLVYSLENSQDGLTLPWIGSVFVNGPYSNPLPWCRRLASHSGLWCSLWKLDPTTRWFSVLKGIKGGMWAPFKHRLRYERPGNCGTANFPSFLCWGGGWQPGTGLIKKLWYT